MIELEVVVEPVLDWRPGGKLRLRLDAQNRGRKHVSTRVTDPFQLRHRRTFMGARLLGGSDIFSG